MLPFIISEDLNPTRDYLRDVALAVGSLQRAFLPAEKHLWQHGLEVSMRGFSTQAFMINDKEFRVGLDLVRSKVRIGEIAWSFHEYNGAEIFKNIRVWLETQGVRVDLEEPKWGSVAGFDSTQSKNYAEALWWMDRQFKIIKAGISEGLTSPVLLYPHHFDLALSWFPWDDDRQITLGFSAGDENIREPYVYLTVYPEPHQFKNMELPAGLLWQKKGFNGVVLHYAVLQANEDPEEMLSKLSALMHSSKKLLASV